MYAVCIRTDMHTDLLDTECSLVGSILPEIETSYRFSMKLCEYMLIGFQIFTCIRMDIWIDRF